MMMMTMIHHVTFAVAFFNSNDQTKTHEKKKTFCSIAWHKENELKQEAKHIILKSTMV